MAEPVPSLTISPPRLVAVARWASDDGDRPHLGLVVIRDRELFACDGHRLVRVPLAGADPKLALGIQREHVFAAAAAQAAISGAALRDPDGRPAIHISLTSTGVRLDLGPASLLVSDRDISTVLSRESLAHVMPNGAPGDSPAGHIFNPSYLACMAEVQAALVDRSVPMGVRIAAWGPVRDGARGEGVLFEGALGVRFVIMPMRSM